MQKKFFHFNCLFQLLFQTTLYLYPIAFTLFLYFKSNALLSALPPFSPTNFSSIARQSFPNSNSSSFLLQQWFILFLAISLFQHITCWQSHCHIANTWLSNARGGRRCKTTTIPTIPNGSVWKKTIPTLKGISFQAVEFY